jgi:urea transport system substrate-binding protein
VLVVEDDDDMREAICEIAVRAGMGAVGARNGLEALRVLERCGRLPDLVLLDLRMPVMDGWEFLRLRSPAVAAIPLVVLTGAAGGRIPAGLPTLLKPITCELLLHAMVSQLR